MKNKSVKIPNDSAALAQLCGTIREFLQGEKLPSHTLYVVDLTLEEMLTNIIKYGYDDKNRHEIAVSVSVSEKEVLVSIEDDGHEFNPLALPEANVYGQVKERKVGGVGVHLTRKMSRAMEYRRADGKNILKIFIDIK